MDPLVYKLIWVFGWVLVILAVWYVRGRRRQRTLELIHHERMAALDKGVPLPELPDYGQAIHAWKHRGGEGRPLNPRWPLGIGAIFFMLGAGLCLALWLSGDRYHNAIWPFGLIGVWMIPAAFAVVFWSSHGAQWLALTSTRLLQGHPEPGRSQTDRQGDRR